MSYDLKYCPECQAKNLGIADRCFLCRRDLKSVKPVEIIPAKIVHDKAPNRALEWLLGISCCMLIGLLILVSYTLWTLSPSQGLGFTVLVVPALILAMLGMSVPVMRGKCPHWLTVLLLFLTTIVGSVTLTVLVLLCLIVATLNAMFQTCASFGPGR